MELERVRRGAPSRVANASRNAAAGPGRRRRWAPARDALWDFVEPHLDDGARAAIVGAGNGDDLPLDRIVERADEVVLLDIDPIAARGAWRRLRRSARRKVDAIGHDMTGGEADRIALVAAGGKQSTATADRSASPAPLPGAPYDLVLGDLFYSQLLYPALLDLEVETERRDAVLAEHGPPLTRAVVARLHASAPLVLHVHDPLAWWDGHDQPFALEEVLDTAEGDGPEAALGLIARGLGPTESDPRTALADLGLHPVATAFWPWPFAPEVDYLACATLVTE